jgi:DivIVA domain-containing protein
MRAGGTRLPADQDNRHGYHLSRTRCWTADASGGDDRFVDADPDPVYLLETAKDRLARDLPGYRIADVDSFLDGVLAALRRGEPPSPADVRAVTFPRTRWRIGYAPPDVDRLIGELAQLLRRPETDADVPPGVRKLADRIRISRFGTTHRGGYDQKEVDEFLDKITGNLTRGERGTLQQLAGEARFTTVRLRPGYRMTDVDSLLASVEHALADLSGDRGHRAGEGLCASPARKVSRWGHSSVSACWSVA